MTFTQSLKSCFQKYFRFSGRASRSEFWYFMLFYILGASLFGLAAVSANNLVAAVGATLAVLFLFICLIPLIAVQVRRLHDTNRSGAWCLLQFIPYIGGLILLILSALKGTIGSNRFGPNPLDMLETA